MQILFDCDRQSVQNETLKKSLLDAVDKLNGAELRKSLERLLRSQRQKEDEMLPYEDTTMAADQDTIMDACDERKWKK